MISSRPLIRWLDATVAAVALAVVVGGITRLTESGLSITEWKPIAGMLPPMNAADWEAAYQRFLLIPQAQTIHAGITLPAFKGIFWWEWVHRQVARMVGLVIALPYFWFLVRRQIPRAHRLPLMALPLLVAAQGALGWYMVSSGLSVRSNVSQYRLVAHLGLALVILVVAAWTAAALRADAAEAGSAGPNAPDGARKGQAAAPGATRWAAVTMLYAIWTFGVILTGGFVAGLRAGKIYNTFPLMGGQVVPPGYWPGQGFLTNAFENPTAAQFHHRVLAILTVLVAYGLWIAAVRRPMPAAVVKAQGRVAIAATLQVALGITTLLLAVPVAVAALHQLVAVVLLGAAVLAAHTARRVS
ncbi:MAG: COX15/CtaA family protein [Gemmatimonadaceae bacterium]